MTKRPRQPSADAYRKVRFREMAREIVAKDRHDQRYGQVVDTAGAIARALERVYRQGFEDAQTDCPTAKPEVVPDEGAFEWTMIPPRPRTAFWSICLFCLGRGDRPDVDGYMVPETTERGTPSWRLVAFNDRDIKVIGENTLKPLLRLGLLALTEDTPRRLIVSDRGVAARKRFVERGGQFPEDLTSV
ncbi:hypothetical protein GGE65_007599 [Skermanella aerolata]|uniref:hypothetical protein n=1 Tax=Skermanella aerolata TaxID=393310 RepID=UPI003D19FA21